VEAAHRDAFLRLELKVQATFPMVKATTKIMKIAGG
jgi:hypothetical protein